MPLDDALVSALPEGAARALLAGMRPDGRANAKLRVLIPPGDGPPQVIGALDLRGVQAYLHEVDPSLAGLAEEPLRGITGSIFLDVPHGVELTAIRGELAGAKVEATGAIRQPPVCPPDLGGALGGLAGVLCAASELSPAAIDLTVHVGDLMLNERTRAMAGPAASDVFTQFQPEGPVDLQARVHRAPLASRTRMRLRARPRGLTVVPSFLPLRVSELEGEVEVEDGEPVRIDLNARAGGAVVTIRRDQATERAFPGAGTRGRVFEVVVRDFARPADPRERAELERELPDPGAVRSLLTALAPEGPLDLHAFIYQPLAERQPIRWVAELRAGPQNDPGSPDGPSRVLAVQGRPDFALSAGLRFEAIRGTVRATGSVAELERGTCEGEVELSQLDCWKQTARNAVSYTHLTLPTNREV